MDTVGYILSTLYISAKSQTFKRNYIKAFTKSCVVLTLFSNFSVTFSYSWDNPCIAVHVLVPPSRLDRVINRLADSGYDEGPEPSKEISICEGTRLELSFHGNIRRDDEQQSTPLVFHFHGDVESHFQLSPVDEFLQKQLDSYRGVIDVYRLTQNSKKEVDSDSGRSKYIRELVASHHVNIPKEVYSLSTLYPAACIKYRDVQNVLSLAILASCDILVECNKPTGLI